MKLYSVDIELYAKEIFNLDIDIDEEMTEQDADEIFQHYKYEILENNTDIIFSWKEIKKEGDIANEWKDCYPFGLFNSNLSCLQILAERKKHLAEDIIKKEIEGKQLTFGFYDELD